MSDYTCDACGKKISGVFISDWLGNVVFDENRVVDLCEDCHFKITTAVKKEWDDLVKQKE